MTTHGAGAPWLSGWGVRDYETPGFYHQTTGVLYCPGCCCFHVDWGMVVKIMSVDSQKRYLYDWRRNFSESELADIDAASTGSLVGRLAATLERLTIMTNRCELTVDFSRRPHE